MCRRLPSGLEGRERGRFRDGPDRRVVAAMQELTTRAVVVEECSVDLDAGCCGEGGEVVVEAGGGDL
ncbi:hypothetical protein GCM10010210_45590 [Pseudonocardia hydrocarbonoxydans]|uniref:Uncharacterized protein n=1 Tax=Pseudonocardia hydrocarbonoxydans TaxID=76726 RepID=A0A4Y3WYR9_9PSEU|nr:hypothetical protein PHY01_48790 [Pseudonocardia hydrocarbonoxydans]